MPQMQAEKKQIGKKATPASQMRENPGGMIAHPRNRMIGTIETIGTSVVDKQITRWHKTSRAESPTRGRQA